MKLTIKQKAFADYYIKLGNATEAAVRAGYKKKTAYSIGCENLKKPDIKVYIEQRLKEIEDSRIASAKEVVEYLSAVMRGDQQEEVIVVEGTGDGCSEARGVNKDVSAKERIKAAELLGKRYGIFTDNTNINASVGVTIVDDI